MRSWDYGAGDLSDRCGCPPHLGNSRRVIHSYSAPSMSFRKHFKNEPLCHLLPPGWSELEEETSGWRAYVYLRTSRKLNQRTQSEFPVLITGFKSRAPRIRLERQHLDNFSLPSSRIYLSVGKRFQDEVTLPETNAPGQASCIWISGSQLASIPASRLKIPYLNHLCSLTEVSRRITVILNPCRAWCVLYIAISAALTPQDSTKPPTHQPSGTQQ